jgi:hypothetical protein
LKRLLAVTAITALSAAAGADAHAGATIAGVRNCKSAAGPTVVITSARNMRCRTAARDMSRYRGSIRRRFKTPGGFTCHRVSGGRLAGQWRCVRGDRAYRFDFED